MNYETSFRGRPLNPQNTEGVANLNPASHKASRSAKVCVKIGSDASDFYSYCLFTKNR